jgi:hypothetical protein
MNGTWFENAPPSELDMSGPQGSGYPGYNMLPAEEEFFTPGAMDMAPNPAQDMDQFQVRPTNNYRNQPPNHPSSRQTQMAMTIPDVLPASRWMETIRRAVAAGQVSPVVLSLAQAYVSQLQGQPLSTETQDNFLKRAAELLAHLQRQTGTEVGVDNLEQHFFNNPKFHGLLKEWFEIQGEAVSILDELSQVYTDIAASDPNANGYNNGYLEQAPLVPPAHPGRSGGRQQQQYLALPPPPLPRAPRGRGAQYQHAPRGQNKQQAAHGRSSNPRYHPTTPAYQQMPQMSQYSDY